jgi:hypothetical protein
MSGDGTMDSAPGGSKPAMGSEPRLYDASGEPLRPASGSSHNQTDQLAAFIQEQPLTAAMVALVVGYLLGKVT